MVWGKTGSNTLTVAGDTLTVSGTSSEFNQIMSHIPFTTYGGGRIIFDNDSGNNYGDRYSLNGASDSVSTNQPDIFLVADNTKYDQFSIAYICNIDGKESLLIGFGMNQGAVGAGSAPPRREIVGKWYSTTQFTRIDITNENPTLGDFLVDSNLTALGSDLTPAAAIPGIDNVQDNSLFVDKVNAKRYWFTPNTVTLQSDFSSSTGWTTSSSSLLNVDTSAQEIDFTFNVDNGDIGTMYYDLTSTSDTKWLLRSQIDIDTIAQGSDTSDKWLFYGLSSTNNGANETQDFLGMAIRVDNTKTELFAIETDGSAPNNESTTVFTRNAQAETLYVEMKRESATSFTVSLYSDSAYSTLLESKTITASSGTATLRYLKLSGLQGFSDSQIVGSIPNMTFYNSATTLATWTWDKLTYQTDFSSDTDWVMTNKMSVTGGNMYANGVNANEQYYAYYDLGLLSDTKWYVEIDFKYTNSGGGEAMIVGLSSGTSLIWQNGGADAVAINCSGTGSIGGRVRYNTTDDHFSSGGTIPTDGTWKYLVFERYDVNTMKLHVYSSASDRTNKTNGTTYTGSIDQSNGDGTDITSLRYLQIGGWYVANHSGRVIYAYWDNIKVYDGVNW